MPIELLNTEGLDPDETHKYDCGTWLRFDDREGTTQTGMIFDRGYTRGTDTPVYAVICEDNIERSVTEANADHLPPNSEAA